MSGIRTGRIMSATTPPVRTRQHLDWHDTATQAGVIVLLQLIELNRYRTVLNYSRFSQRCCLHALRETDGGETVIIQTIISLSLGKAAT